MKIEAVTFDAGDTLLQPLAFPPDAWFSQLCRLAGIALTSAAAMAGARARKQYEEAHRTSRENPMTEEWLRARDAAGLRAAGVSGDVDPMVDRLRAATREMPRGWRLDPDAVAVLDALTRRGVRIGIVSNWGSELRDRLDRLGVGRYLAVVTDSQTAGWDKPDPRIYGRTCDALGVRPQDCVHVGDSLIDDVGMANAVGAAPVLYDPLQCLDCDCARILRLTALVPLLFHSG